MPFLGDECTFRNAAECAGGVGCFIFYWAGTRAWVCRGCQR